MNIIFVCTGNTCRSPMAEGFFKTLSADSAAFEACSRGIAAIDGMRASEYSVIAASELGSDIANHASHQITQADVSWADFIFTMTSSHASVLKAAFPESSQKIFTIAEFALSADVSDPYGGDLAIYRECAAQLKAAVQKIYDKLSDDNNEHTL